MDADASQKMVRFVDLCDTFHLPIVNFVDNPGFEIGVEAERRGTIRHGVRALTAIYQASVPWCSILVRRVLRRGRRRSRRAPSLEPALRVAERGVGLAADRGRRRGRVSPPDRSRAEDPDALRAGARGEARIAALAAADRRGVRRRGDHRPARHAAAARRVGAARLSSCCRAGSDRRRAACDPEPGGSPRETRPDRDVDRLLRLPLPARRRPSWCGGIDSSGAS